MSDNRGVTARMFLAVRPDDAVRSALRAIPRPHEPGVRWVPQDQWHVTLRFWPHADPDRVIGAMDDAADRLATLDPVVAEFGPVVSRLGRSAVVVPVSGLDALAMQIRDTTAQVPPPPDPRPFTGHLTLARLRHRAACGIAGASVSAQCAVREVELVASELSESGAQHEVIGRWPIGRASG